MLMLMLMLIISGIQQEQEFAKFHLMTLPVLSSLLFKWAGWL